MINVKFHFDLGYDVNRVFRTYLKDITFENNRSGRVLLELLKVAFELRKLTPEFVERIIFYHDNLPRVEFAPRVLDELRQVGITIDDLPKAILEKISPYSGLGEEADSYFILGAIEPAF